MHPNSASKTALTHPKLSTSALPEWFSKLASALQASGLPHTQARWRLCWIEKFLTFVSRQPGERPANWPTEVPPRFLASLGERKPLSPWVHEEVQAGLQ